MSNTTKPDLPNSIQAWLLHLEQDQRYSPHTLSNYRRDMRQLVDLFQAIHPDTLQEAQLRQGLAQLHKEGMAPRSLARILSAWRSYYQWRSLQEQWPRNPASALKAPRSPKSLPKALSIDQTQALLDRNGLAEPSHAQDKRNQAMFELFYSCGLRLAELVSLDVYYRKTEQYESQSWLLLDSQEVSVHGKGGKRRLLPIGGKALHALQQWLSVRVQLVGKKTNPDADAALFLGARGARIHPRIVQQQLEIMAQQVGLPMQVHPHSLRHSFASHLLQSSQDLRAVQELLGHSTIATTQIYTRLDFQHLAQVYDQAHPRARRKKTD